MPEQVRSSQNTRTIAIARAVVVFGIGIPAVLLAVLYGGSQAAGIDFGNVVFVLSGVTVLAWVVFAGWGRRMDAARPGGELLRLSATDYGKEVARGTYAHLPEPARLLVVLTGAVVLGWILLLATL